MPVAPPFVDTYHAIDSMTVFLSWSAPPVDQQNGLIRHYNITLTELETGSIFSYTTSHINITISLLHPDYRYQIEISAVTVGTGPTSLPAILHMPEDGRKISMRDFKCFYTSNNPWHTAPSAPPDSVIIDEIDSNSIYLSWTAPPLEYHNGDINGYNVTITATNGEDHLTTFSATNSTRITSLDPFTTYTVRVAAVTDVGIGPYSTAITFMTDEAGMKVKVIS